MSEFSRFIGGLASSLHAGRILYMGCCNVDDLSGFPEDAQVCGITQEPEILESMVERYPAFEFRQASPLETPYEDGRFDFVFTHKFFNYLDGDQTVRMLAEMYRVSSKYIVNFEMFSEKEEVMDDGVGRYCGMYSKWLDYQVRIISNVQMHQDIDPEQCQFTLVRKAG